MQRVNPGGLYATVQASLPHLAADGRIIVVSPPIYRRFVRGKTGYAMGKVGLHCSLSSFWSLTRFDSSECPR